MRPERRPAAGMAGRRRPPYEHSGAKAINPGRGVGRVLGVNAPFSVDCGMDGNELADVIERFITALPVLWNGTFIRREYLLIHRSVS